MGWATGPWGGGGRPGGVWRAVAPCLAAGLDIRIALLPPGHDPDSLIRDEGPEAFQKVLSGALDPVEFAAAKLAPERGREEADWIFEEHLIWFTRQAS